MDKEPRHIEGRKTQIKSSAGFKAVLFLSDHSHIVSMT